MKTLTKKLVLSLSVMLLALVAVATSTYAWFTINGTVTTDQFTMQAETGSDLKVELYGITNDGKYVSITNGAVGKLSTDDFKKALSLMSQTAGESSVTPSTDFNQTDNKNRLEAVTSLDGMNIIELKTRGVEVTSYEESKGKVDKNIGKYYTFALAFSSSNDSKGDVALKKDGTEFSNSSTKQFVPKVKFNGTDELQKKLLFYKNGVEEENKNLYESIPDGKDGDEKLTFGLSSAIRISFIVTSVNTSANEQGYLSLNESPYTKAIIWEPGKNFGQGSMPYEMDKNYAVNYYNASKTGDTITEEQYQGWVAKLPGGYTAASTPNDGNLTYSTTDIVNQTICTINDSTPVFVTVKIWIEGWDADCLDAIQDLSATLKMAFTYKGTE